MRKARSNSSGRKAKPGGPRKRAGLPRNATTPRSKAAGRLEMSLLEEKYGIARLAPDAEIPEWAMRGKFVSITRSADELSVVTAEKNIPEGVRAQGHWNALKLHGPFAFSEIGVVSAIAKPLADEKIGIFVISTFDTDYLLLDSGQLKDAVRVLSNAGHKVHGL